MVDKKDAGWPKGVVISRRMKSGWLACFFCSSVFGRGSAGPVKDLHFLHFVSLLCPFVLLFSVTSSPGERAWKIGFLFLREKDVMDDLDRQMDSIPSVYVDSVDVLCDTRTFDSYCCLVLCLLTTDIYGNGTIG